MSLLFGRGCFGAASVVVFLTSACWGHSDGENKETAAMREALLRPAVSYRCKTAREFVTTYNFLNDAEYLNLSADQSRSIAERVVAGCDGAARRFVEVVTLLSRARLDSRNSIRIAEKMARANDDQAEAFMEVFKRAYLKKYLDLDLLASIRIAESLSIDFEGSSKQAREDYSRLVEHCVEKSGFNLPRPVCGEMAMRLARHGQAPRTSVVKAYFASIEFLTTDDDGPKLALKDALALAEDLVAASPAAVENFGKAYEFSASKKGLGLERVRAVQQARTIALMTRQQKAPAIIPEASSDAPGTLAPAASAAGALETEAKP